MSREVIDFLDKDDKISAQDTFKSVMGQKVGDALEIKRKDISNTFVGKQEVEETDEV